MSTYRMAVITTAATFLLILAGGLVHSTGSGLACPDWPLCHGMFFPPMVGNIRFEHGHRLIAGTVGLLTLATSILVLRRERSGLRPYALAAVGSIVLQIILGGLTVIFRLPDLVSTAHLAVGTAFFSLLVFLTVRIRSAGPYPALAPGRRRLIWVCAGLVYIQMILGALVRHTESGLACPAIPACGDVWFPSPGSPQGLQMIHRFGSILVLVLTVWMYARLRRISAFEGWAAVIVGLTGVQIVLGALSVVSGLRLWVVMAHLAVAESMMLCLVVLLARTSIGPAQQDNTELQLSHGAAQ